MLTTEWSPVDRSIGLGIVLCALVMVVADFGVFVEQVPRFAGWWLWACAVFPVVFVALAAGWRRWPAPLLRAAWIGLPLLLLGMLLLTYRAWLPDHGGLPVTVLWLLDAPLLCLMALAIRPRYVFATLLATSMSLPVSALVFIGDVPRRVLAAGFVHGSVLMFIAICLVLRRQLHDVHRAHSIARELRAEEHRTQIVAREYSEFARMIHDEVLSSFAAVTWFQGDVPDEMRQAAGSALRALRGHRGEARDVFDDEVRLDTEDAARLVGSVIASAAPNVPLTVRQDSGEIPASVASALALAAAEAVRNAVRYADGVHGAVIAEDGRLVVTIRDRGRGFDPAAIPADHFGVRDSILGRVRSLPGGTASIASGQGGTTVEVAWVRPEL